MQAFLVKSSGLTTERDWGVSYLEVPEGTDIARRHLFAVSHKGKYYISEFTVNGNGHDFANWKRRAVPLSGICTDKENSKNRGLKTHFEFLIPDFAVPPAYQSQAVSAQLCRLAERGADCLDGGVPEAVSLQRRNTFNGRSAGTAYRVLQLAGMLPGFSTMAALPRSMAAA